MYLLPIGRLALFGAVSHDKASTTSLESYLQFLQWQHVSDAYLDVRNCWRAMMGWHTQVDKT